MMKKIKIIKNVSLFIFLLIAFILINFKVNISESAPIGIYFINRLSKKYDRGDYVVYKINSKYREYMLEELRKLDTIKQIKGIENDRVKYENNKIFINDKLMGKVLFNIPINSKKEYTIPKDEFLTIGDVDYSLDGRYYGLIKKEDIKYKAYLIYRFKK